VLAGYGFSKLGSGDEVPDNGWLGHYQ
jgi:hypothetical protein